MKTKHIALSNVKAWFTKTATAIKTASLKNTLFLLNSTSTTGNNNPVFKELAANKTITNTGGVAQGSFTPYGKNWSVYFNSTAAITYPANANFGFGTGAFTIECWINMRTLNTNACEFLDLRTSVGNTALAIPISSTGLIGFYDGPSNANVFDSTNQPLALNTWYHIALSRDTSNVWRLFKNGVQVATRTSANNLGNAQPALIGGAINGAAYYFNGNISNFRMIKGSALYTANFTPPTSPLTAVAGTTLLSCAANTMVDISSFKAIPTLTSAPIVTRLSPFGNQDETTDAYGDSLFFNNNAAQYLTTVPGDATAFGTGDYTIEFWFNTQKSIATDGVIFDNRGNSGAPFAAGGYNTSFSSGFGISSNSFNLGYNGTILQNQWYHVALVRKSGTATLYLNGNVCGSAVDIANYTTSSNSLVISKHYQYSYQWYGYLADIRFSKTAVYTGAFIPPTAPLTADSNTTLLISGSNANIKDFAGNIDIVSSNTVASNAVTKFASHPSLSFSGTTYLNGNTVAAPNMSGFGRGNFTVECWAYATSTPNAWYILDSRTTGSNSGWALFMSNSGNNLSWFDGTTVRSSGVAVSSNTWNHIAVVRISGISAIYLNGALIYSWTDTVSYPTNANMWVGTYSGTPGTAGFVGYLQDIRISNNAVYTSPFTPPTKSFIDEGKGTLSPIAYAPVVLADAPYAYYKLNETSGTIAVDSSGNNRNGSYVGTIVKASAPLRPAEIIPSAFFPGNNTSYVDISASAALFNSTAWTLECWIQPTSFANIATSNNPGITMLSSMSGTFPGQGQDWVVGGNTSNIVNAFWWWPANNKDVYKNNSGIAINNTYHLVITYSSGTLVFYINGVEVQTSTSVSTTAVQSTLYLGRQSWIGGPMTGFMSDFALYNKVLSASQVATHFRAGLGSI